jgi:hypothetical protein
MLFMSFAHEIDTIGTSNFFNMFYRSVEVEFIGLFFNNFESTRRTGTDAVAKAIAISLFYQLRLAIDQLQSAFRASGNAVSATVAEIFVYSNDFSGSHRFCSFVFFVSYIIIMVESEPFSFDLSQNTETY